MNVFAVDVLTLLCVRPAVTVSRSTRGRARSPDDQRGMRQSIVWTCSGRPNASVRLQASGVANGWLAAFCTPSFCSPKRVDVRAARVGPGRLSVRADSRSGRMRPSASAATITESAGASVRSRGLPRLTKRTDCALFRARSSSAARGRASRPFRPGSVKSLLRTLLRMSSYVLTLAVRAADARGEERVAGE